MRFNKNLLAAGVDFSPVIAPILEVINALLWPSIAIVGAVGTIYCIFLGLKIAKSDEQNSREKAKKRFNRGDYRVSDYIRSDCRFENSNAYFAKLGTKTSVTEAKYGLVFRMVLRTVIRSSKEHLLHYRFYS